MSQQIIPIVSIVSVAPIVVAGDEMSDLQYLAIKEFEGKTKTAQNDVSAIGLLTSLTATDGKDLYLAKAKVTFYMSILNTQSYINNKVVLDLDGTIIEPSRMAIHFNSNSLATSGNATVVYEFACAGLKVDATKVIKLDVLNLSLSVDVSGYLQGWEEDTGTSPQIPPLNPV